jgi:tripartite-type tricarboxylate transporter receptor subunit TctC
LCPRRASNSKNKTTLVRGRLRIAQVIQARERTSKLARRELRHLAERLGGQQGRTKRSSDSPGGMIMKKLTFILVAAVVALFSAALRADDYPTRPITFVAVFGPGSASDTICRIIADRLSPMLGQPIVVEDRPGADGALAALYVHHQPADGYTLLMGTNSPLSADPFIHKDINYDPIKDFVPVTRVGSFTLMLVVDPKLPIHSVRELIDYAKANPGKLTYASGNTAGIVGMETVKRWAEVSILHVPYKTTAPAIEDIIAGRVSMMFADFTSAMPHVKAGTLRPLAISRIKRSSLFPDLPTMNEAGVKGFNLDAWAGLVAPTGTPPEIITKLNGALRQVIDSPDVQAKFKNVGFEGFSSTPEELGSYMKAEIVDWGKMVKDAGIKPD